MFKLFIARAFFLSPLQNIVTTKLSQPFLLRQRVTPAALKEDGEDKKVQIFCTSPQGSVNLKEKKKRKIILFLLEKNMRFKIQINVGDGFVLLPAFGDLRRGEKSVIL